MAYISDKIFSFALCLESIKTVKSHVLFSYFPIKNIRLDFGIVDNLN